MRIEDSGKEIDTMANVSIFFVVIETEKLKNEKYKKKSSITTKNLTHWPLCQIFCQNLIDVQICFAWTLYTTVYVKPTSKILFRKSMLHSKPLIKHIGVIVTYVSAWILLHHQRHSLCRHLYPIPSGDLNMYKDKNLNSSNRIKNNVQKVLKVCWT